jgi:PBP1b-binding outer membrane lipoprotein LpoB
VGGFLQKDYTVLVMGAIITTMAIFNVGCFGGQCAPKKMNKQASNQNIEEVTFEEVL